MESAVSLLRFLHEVALYFIPTLSIAAVIHFVKKRPAELEDVGKIISTESFRVVNFTVKDFSKIFLTLQGQLTVCRYTLEGNQETLEVKINSRYGTLFMYFEDETLVTWRSPGNKDFIPRETTTPHDKWILNHILSQIQNAINLSQEVIVR
jgi:hypothetical protein